MKRVEAATPRPAQISGAPTPWEFVPTGRLRIWLRRRWCGASTRRLGHGVDAERGCAWSARKLAGAAALRPARLRCIWPLVAAVRWSLRPANRRRICRVQQRGVALVTFRKDGARGEDNHHGQPSSVPGARESRWGSNYAARDEAAVGARDRLPWSTSPSYEVKMVVEGR
ncbi:hypothetical protein ACQJBY_035586 [Aegilops geniculata]